MTAWDGVNRRENQEMTLRDERRAHLQQTYTPILKGIAFKNIYLTIVVILGGISLLVYFGQFAINYDVVRQNEVRSLSTEVKADNNEKTLIGIEKDIDYIKKDIGDIKAQNDKILEKLDK